MKNQDGGGENYESYDPAPENVSVAKLTEANLKAQD